MQPPPERKTRILVTSIGVLVMLATVGNFLWPVLKDYLHSPPGAGKHFLLIFLLFGLVFVAAIIFSFARQLRAPAQSSLAAIQTPAGGKAGGIFLFLFATPFAAFGIFALVQAWIKWVAGHAKDAAGLGVFGLIFCGVGFGLMAASIFGAKKSKQTAAIQTQHPDAPWLWRPDWATGEIKSSDNNSFVVLWFMALIFCAVGGFIVSVVLPQELAKGNHAALLALLFPVAGLGLLGAAIYQTLRRKKYGAVGFKMSSVPGVIGGALAGAICIPAHFQPEAGVHLQLRCVRRVTTGSGKNQHTSEEVLWEDEKVLGDNLPRTGMDEFDVPVFFKIPGNARQTDGSQPRDQIVWHLTATSRQPGINLRADFDVPVFRTAQSGTADFLTADATAKYQVPAAQITAAEDPRIKINDLPGGGKEFYFPAARNVGNAIGATLFWLVWMGFFLLFAKLFGNRHAELLHRFDFGETLFGIIWALADIAIFIAVLNCWLKRVRVTISRDAVIIAKYWLFFGGAKTIPASDVADFSVAQGIQSGSTIYRTIKLQARSGKNITVITMIRSVREAEWLAAQMKRAVSPPSWTPSRPIS